MATSVGIIIIDKTGTVKTLNVKDYKEEDLFKKCGFKKPDGVKKQHTWTVKYNKVKYLVSVFGKENGHAGMENKYDFPPPIDTKLFFGSCAVVAQLKDLTGKLTYTTLTDELWDKIYEKLFGGFEDLTVTCKDDEMEEDELEHVDKHKKTKDGYLKDGFVVDSDKEEEDSCSNYEDVSDDNSDDNTNEEEDDEDEEVETEELGSELSEDSYDY